MTRSEFVKGYAEKTADKLRDDGHCSNDKDAIIRTISEHMMCLLLDIGTQQ